MNDKGGNRQYFCLPFCWSGHEGWDNFQKIIFRKEGTAENGDIDFEIGDTGTSVHWYWRLKKISCRACLIFITLLVTKTAFKSPFDLIIRSLLNSIKHGFTNRRCLHCAILRAFHGSQEKRAHKSKDTQFFLQNEIFKIFKNMFKNNMKFTRAACWIDSKISNRHRNTTLTIFLFCRYCWSLLRCNYWKSLKSDSHLPKNSFICFNESPLKVMKNAFYFILKALLVLKIFKFLYWLFGHVKKPGLIRKIRLLSKVMTPQPGYKQLYYTYCAISH